MNRQSFLKERTGIGGSSAAAILGVSKWKTVSEVYDTLVQVLDGTYEPDETLTPDQERGIVLEPIAVARYVKETNRQVRRQGQKRHPEYPFMIGNIDRQIIGEERGPGVLEVKCPRWKNYIDIRDFGLANQDDYNVQVQHYLAVYGYSWASFAAFHADTMSLTWFDVERSDKFIDDVLIPRLETFWNKHVLPRVPPSASINDEEAGHARLLLPTVGGRVDILETDRARQLAESYILHREMRLHHQKQEETAKREIAEIAGTAGAFEIPGQLRGVASEGRWRWQAGGQKRFAAALAAAGIDEKQYKQQGEPYWRLTPIGASGGKAA